MKETKEHHAIVCLYTEGRVQPEVCHQYNTISTKVWLHWTGFKFETNNQFGSNGNF